MFSAFLNFFTPIHSILVGIIITLTLSVGGYVWWANNEIKTLNDNNSKLTVSLQTEKDAVKALKDKAKLDAANLTKLNKAQRAIKNKTNIQLKKFKDLNLLDKNNLSSGTSEKNINEYYKQLFENLNKISGGTP